MTTMSCALLEQLQTISDPRRPCRNLKHRLVDVLLSAFCAVLADCNDFVEIADWARHHEEFLRTFLELPNGIPAHDTFNRVFAAVDPQAFRGLLPAGSAPSRPAGRLGPHRRQDRAGHPPARKGLGALHLVSAWASQDGLTLGQVAVDAKSNEITAIPQLLELLDLHDSVGDHRRHGLPEGDRRADRGPAAATTCWRSRTTSRRSMRRSARRS